MQESCHIICYYDRAIIVPLEKFISFKKVILKNIFSISSLSFEITKTFKELALITGLKSRLCVFIFPIQPVSEKFLA